MVERRAQRAISKTRAAPRSPDNLLERRKHPCAHRRWWPKLMRADMKRAARLAPEAARETPILDSQPTAQLHWRQEGAPSILKTSGRKIGEREIAGCPAGEVWWM